MGSRSGGHTSAPISLWQRTVQPSGLGLTSRRTCRVTRLMRLEGGGCISNAIASVRSSNRRSASIVVDQDSSHVLSSGNLSLIASGYVNWTMATRNFISSDRNPCQSGERRRRFATCVESLDMRCTISATAVSASSRSRRTLAASSLPLRRSSTPGSARNGRSSSAFPRKITNDLRSSSRTTLASSATHASHRSLARVRPCAIGTTRPWMRVSTPSVITAPRNTPPSPISPDTFQHAKGHASDGPSTRRVSLRCIPCRVDLSEYQGAGSAGASRPSRAAARLAPLPPARRGRRPGPLHRTKRHGDAK